MGKRKGNKKELFLSTKRRKCNNLREYNKFRKSDIAYLSKSTTISTAEDMNSQLNTIEIDSDSPSLHLDNLQVPEETISERESVIFENNGSAIDDTKKSLEFEINGRRIINIAHFFKSLQQICNHNNSFGCTLLNLNIVNEIRQGFNSIIEFKCNMCNSIFNISTNESSSTDRETNILGTNPVNSAAVEGAMCIGIGHNNMEELFNTMEIPCINKSTYKKYRDLLIRGWEEVAFLKMKEAAEKEAKYALETGNVDKNGIPCITVVADGCWSKRSYRSNYNALSGAAAIIGRQFGEVLHLGIKNKFCFICRHSEKNDEQTPEHMCNKNFNGSSTSMEASIIVEGFKNSLSLHGLKYTKMIADGDSSCYKKILESNPYPGTIVEKIECKNHVLRNFCNKLKSICTDTRYPLNIRRMLSGRILRLRRAIQSAINFRKVEETSDIDKVKYLKQDIENSIKHVFGEHSNCASYFCEQKEEENIYTNIQNCEEFYTRLLTIIKSVSLHSRSLIYDVDSNVVEQFNSIIAKFVGGKRINYSKSNSYQGRCYAALVSYNSKNRAHYTFHKTLFGASPSICKQKFEIKRQIQNARTLKIRKHQGKQLSKIFTKKKQQCDADYGDYCQKPDMDSETFNIEKHIFLKSLEKTEEAKKQFERDTILQSGSSLWLEERKKLLTASNFGTICKRRPSTSCEKLVLRLLYGKELLNVPSITYGKVNESIARQQLERQLNVKIELCGMFIDKIYPYLGASPDGIFNKNTILEIKCPYNPTKKTFEQLFSEKRIDFWKIDKNTKEMIINKKHNWWYQIQGQLRITDSQECILAIWTGENQKIKTESIKRDDDFWSKCMEKKLEDFYMNCILPEIIDSRHARNMKIRQDK